jgi:PAS domain S-box-containing protein
MLLLTGLLISFAMSMAYLIHPSFIRSTNNRTTDVVMAFAQTKPASGSIVIVDIDENSLAKYGQWPWPRYRFAQLLNTINASGADSIGLDLILAEPDRTSPKNLQTGIDREFGYHNGTSGISIDQPVYDQNLAGTLAKGPFVLGYEFLFRNSAKPETSCGLHPPGIAWINRSDTDLVQTSFFKARGVVCNRQLFADAVNHSGFLNATPDADGILRRMPMMIRFEGQLYPSLALAMLMQHGNISQIGILQRESGRLDLMVGNRSIIVDTQGNMIVQFSRQSDATPRISAGDLLGGKIPVNQIKSKIVLVGSSAAGLAHVYQTSASPVHTHVDIHAQVLENLLTGQQVVRTQVFLFWEALIGLLVAISTCLTIAKLGILPSAAVCATFLAGSWIGMGYIFQTRGYLLSPLLPTVLVALNYTILTIFKTWKIQLAAREEADNTLVLLKSSEKNLNSIIKAVPDIIFRLDAAGRITFISPAISKYTTSPNALLGKPIFDLVAPEDLPKARYRLNEKRTGERATHGLELRLLLPHRQDECSDEMRQFSVSAEGIYQGDTPCSDEFIGTQGILHDINEQKKLEGKLLTAQKMEAIGSLAAGVAHDLNNILVGLVTYPDLLLLELPPDSPLRAKIAIIQRSGEKAAAIVQDLLTLGRRGVKAAEVINLNVVITDYLASLEFKAARKQYPNTTLESSLEPDLLNIAGSKVHMTKAIVNLLNNAAEAMPAGGNIKLSTFNRYLDTRLKMYEEIPPGEYVCVKVADEGIGISSEDLQRIFEPFYSKKAMRRSGSGLGMTVIWATVRDQGGFIDIQSREGEGTQFVLYFPATRDHQELPKQRIVLEDYIGTEQVLVVDDVPEQLHIASSMLTKLGYRVTAVTSGEAAVENLRAHPADLVVLDMIMPGGMDGMETYMRILEIRPGQRAIITSGFSESERVKALQQMGAGAYVQKPYTLEKFGVAVRRELDRQQK